MACRDKIRSEKRIIIRADEQCSNNRNWIKKRKQPGLFLLEIAKGTHSKTIYILEGEREMEIIGIKLNAFRL